jgi:FKBP-type peptidyl-prolyl cis-trans isomerase FkpA
VSSRFLPAVVAIALAGCHLDAPPAGSAKVDPRYERYADSLHVNIGRMRESPSGVYIEQLKEGSGPAAGAGAVVDVHYTGWLANGTKFDSSREGGQPIRVTLGARQVIPGWEVGIDGMRVGEQRRIVIPSDLAYGPRGAGGVIPPNATLIFEVELVGLQPPLPAVAAPVAPARDSATAAADTAAATKR